MYDGSRQNPLRVYLAKGHSYLAGTIPSGALWLALHDLRTMSDAHLCSGLSAVAGEAVMNDAGEGFLCLLYATDQIDLSSQMTFDVTAVG